MATAPAASKSQHAGTTRVVVAKSALRDLLREVMWNKDFSGWSSNSEGPATVNSNVDPSLAVTDPVNPNFKPQSKTEFGIAVNQLVKNLPDTEMPELYDAVKTAIEDDKDEEDEAIMKTKAAQGGTEQVEEAVRKVIRDIIAEIKPQRRTVKEAPGGRRPPPAVDPNDPRAAPGHTDDQGNYIPVNRVRLAKNAKPGPVVGDLPPVRKFAPGVSGGDVERRTKKNVGDLKRGMGAAIDAYENPKVDPEDEPAAPSAPAAKRAYKATAIGNMADVQGATFDEIAQELGFSVAGAKQAVDKALTKAKFVASLSDTSAEGEAGEGDDLEIITLMAMNDYIKHLARGVGGPEEGEDALTPADIKLMKDHPDIVRELDGFREFLHKYIRKAMSATPEDLDVFGERRPSAAEEEEAVDAVDAAAAGGAAPAAPAAERPAAAPKPAAAPAAAGPKGKKDTYTIYPGAKAYAGPDGKKPPVVTRVGAKVYRAGQDTKFQPKELGKVALGDNGKLRVTKTDGSDHTQEWDPVEANEGRKPRPVLYLRPDGGN